MIKILILTEWKLLHGDVKWINCNERVFYNLQYFFLQFLAIIMLKITASLERNVSLEVIYFLNIVFCQIPKVCNIALLKVVVFLQAYSRLIWTEMRGSSQ